MQTAQPIFQDANGMAVKFFIQRDIPQETQAEVCETIAVGIQFPALYPFGSSQEAKNSPSLIMVRLRRAGARRAR